MLFRAASRWFLARAGRKILPFRQNTTCSCVCMIARNVRRDSFGMGEPRGMLDFMMSNTTSKSSENNAPDAPARSERNTKSIGSRNSFLSIGSVNSVCSIGSVNSAFSIGSIFSFGSVGSAFSSLSIASCLSFMSVLSVLSEASVLSARSYRSVLKAGQQKKAKKP